MTGHTILITGGTSGVGYAVARDAAVNGHRVVIVGHSAERGEVAIESIRREAPEASLRHLRVDLTDLDSIRNLTGRVRSEFPDLDVVSHNAGVLSLKRMTTADGRERTLAINYLGMYALTELLLPHLLERSSARVVCVSGNPGLIERARLDLDDLDLEHGYFGPKAAIRAALAKVLYVTALHERLAGTGLTAATYHPGLVHSGLGNELPFPLSLGFRLINAFLPRRSETGTHMIEADSLAPADAGAGPIFYARSHPVKFRQRHHGAEDRARLMEITAAMTGIEAADAS